MAQDERPPTPSTAWLLLPLGVVVALALAIGLGVALQGRLAPPPPEVDLAPVATGTLPFAALANARDGDWCALVTSGTQGWALQCYFVRRQPDAQLGRDRISIDTSLVDRAGSEWLADAIRATAMSAQGTVISDSTTRTIRGRTFPCRQIMADLPARSSEEPARRTTLWISSEVRSLGVVAARVELVGTRRDVLEWELAGYGSQDQAGPRAEWGRSPLELARDRR